MPKTDLTFGPMTKGSSYDGDREMLVYRDGEIVAEIVANVGRKHPWVNEYIVKDYTVEFYVDYDEEDEEKFETRYFTPKQEQWSHRRGMRIVGDYETARSALAAAKRHVRETLS
jgi:hypothetical protein